MSKKRLVDTWIVQRKDGLDILPLSETWGDACTTEAL